MSLTKIARSYAEALADSAQASNTLAAAADDLNAFAKMVADNRELGALFASPAVSPDDKGKVVEALLARIQPMPIVANLVRVLQRNNRLHILALVKDAFAEELDRRSGVVVGEVTTAKPITDAERQAIEQRLVALTGKKMKLGFATDPALIGGVVTRIGSVIYDGSVRTQLDAIKRRLAQA